MGDQFRKQETSEILNVNFEIEFNFICVTTFTKLT